MAHEVLGLVIWIKMMEVRVLPGAAPQAPTIHRTWRSSKILRRDLNAFEVAEAIILNREEQSPGVCHSHDHCDANMAMEEALKSFGLDVFTPEYDENAESPLDEKVADLWNEAWDIAKASEFAVAGELECMLANDSIGGC